MAVIDEVICPENCATPLPPVEFSDCNPEFNQSEIEAIYVARADFAGFTDVEDLVEWETYLEGTGPYPEPEIVKLIVIGDKPAKTDVTATGSLRRTITYDATHVLNFDIDETNDVNYEFMRTMQCGAKYKIWYETRSKKMYGGNDGLLVSATVADVLNRGDDIERFTGTFTWNNKFDAPRSVSPF